MAVITKAQITRKASEDGVAAKTVERDYVLAHIVAAIAATDEASKLVFKGGTALRLCQLHEWDVDAIDAASCSSGRLLIADWIQARSRIAIRRAWSSTSEAPRAPIQLGCRGAASPTSDLHTGARQYGFLFRAAELGDSLNSRPRKRLGYRTPEERFLEI